MVCTESENQHPERIKPRNREQRLTSYVLAEYTQRNARSAGGGKVGRSGPH